MRKLTVGIDVGTHTTRVVVAEYTSESPLPVILGTGIAESRGMRHGYVINSHEAVRSVKRALHEAEKASGITIKQVVVSIGGISLRSDIAQGSAIISKADSEVTALDVEKAIKESEQSLQLANRQIIFSNLLSCKLDSKDVLGRPEGMKGIKLETRVLYVTALEQHVEDLEAIMLEAGVEVIGIIPAQVAAAAVGLSERQKTVGVALVNIGAETVSLAVYENGLLIGLHVFSIGSSDITNDIALGLKIPLEEAESIKLGTTMSTFPKKKLDEIVEARLSDIFELVESYLRKIKRSELLPAGIIMTGGGSGLPLIEELSRSVLKLPTKIGAGEMITVAKGKLRDSSWFVSYGLTILNRKPGSQGETSSLGGLFQAARDSFKSLLKQFLP